MGINQGPISLDQKYTARTGHVFMTGTQALVRLPMAQMRRDRANGLNTAALHLRLSRLAARRLRPAADGRAKTSRGARHQVPARRERGSRRDRDLGLAAAQPVAGREARWRGRHLVRQGPGRRSLRRRAPPRQYGGLGEARRRALPCRRRSRREIVHRAASVRPRVHLGADAVSLSVQHPRDHRDGAARHRHVALLRLLGRHEGRSPRRSRRPRRSTSPTR